LKEALRPASPAVNAEWDANESDIEQGIAAGSEVGAPHTQEE
jgi:hypothetical protein